MKHEAGSDLCLYLTAIVLRYKRSDDALSTSIFGLCNESPSTKSTTAFLTAKVYSSFTSVATESANSEYFISLFGISLKILWKKNLWVWTVRLLQLRQHKIFKNKLQCRIFHLTNTQNLIVPASVTLIIRKTNEASEISFCTGEILRCFVWFQHFDVGQNSYFEIIFLCIGATWTVSIPWRI